MTEPEPELVSQAANGLARMLQSVDSYDLTKYWPVSSASGQKHARFLILQLLVRRILLPSVSDISLLNG